MALKNHSRIDEFYTIADAQGQRPGKRSSTEMIGSDDRIEKVRRFLDEEAVLTDRYGEIFCGQAAILLGDRFGLDSLCFRDRLGSERW